MDSPEIDFPTIVSVSERIIIVTNINDPTPTQPAITLPTESGWYVAAISNDKCLTGKVPVVYSLEANQFVAKIDKITQAKRASYNKINQMTVIAENTGAVYLIDKNFVVTHAMQTGYTYYGNIQWLDEFTFLMDGFPMHVVGDIRMPKDYVHESGEKPIQITKRQYAAIHNGPFPLYVSTDHRLACTWNLRDYTWSNVFVLPDEVVGTPLCNSRYAAFKCKIMQYGCRFRPY